MILAELYNVVKYFGDRLVFRLPELKIYAGDRIGIVGRNGAGKTTLMNIIGGVIEPDEGICKMYCDTAYAKQLSDQIKSEEAAENTYTDGQLISEFNLVGKTDREGLSGGERTKLKLANAFTSGKLLLLADEPTANLDYKGIELLKQKLSQQESLVIISHDRDLLDSLCTSIVEIKDTSVRMFPGNYSAYAEQMEAELQRAEFEYEQYQGERHRLEKVMRDKKQQSEAAGKKPKGKSSSELKAREFTSARKSFGGKQQGLAKAAKVVEGRLDRMEVKEKPRQEVKIKIDFSLTDPPQGKQVLSGKDIRFGYGTNIIFDNAEFAIQNHTKTALIGENGAGKTTLLNLIVNMHSSITAAPKLKLGYLHQGFEELDLQQTVLQNAMRDSVQREGTVRSVLARLLFRGDDVYKKAEVLSGGERMKLSLAKLVLSTANMLLLDEPTNFLDMASIEAIQGILHEYEGVVLLVSHDRAFINNVTNRLLIVENKKLRAFDGSLEEYDKKLKQEQNMSANQPKPDKLVLELRLSRIVAEMSAKNADREALDAEYKEVLAALKSI